MEEQIEKFKDTRCKHPEHSPASLKHREPGRYKHTCPSCGEQEIFEVPLITL